ncbi:hypothetical protein RDT67_20135 [Serratia fonticola]|uniref:Uncharacterized protein n=1 Tax=Serratia fonticola TaxID=47917 RepID=A0AAJ1YFK3_SERFO|nr:hypothetical protein [Serratia fonticola]MDQ9128731.1 hypothetical protein [Serratia fonticola]
MGKDMKSKRDEINVEMAELKKRIGNMLIYITSPDDELAGSYKEVTADQYYYMSQYYDCLAQRLRLIDNSLIVEDQS